MAVGKLLVCMHLGEAAVEPSMVILARQPFGNSLLKLKWT